MKLRKFPISERIPLFLPPYVWGEDRVRGNRRQIVETCNYWQVKTRRSIFNPLILTFSPGREKGLSFPKSTI